MATQATLASAFTKAAIRFNVAESDYLLLGAMGIANFESLAYRVPKSEDLEDLLKISVGRGRGGADFQQRPSRCMGGV